MSVFNSLEAFGAPRGQQVSRGQPWDRQVGVTGRQVLAPSEGNLLNQQSPPRMPGPGSVGSELPVTGGRQVEAR